MSDCASSNQLALGNGDGTFQSPVAILPDPPELGFSWIAAGDVNNDGWTYILATQFQFCCGALYVLVNNQITPRGTLTSFCSQTGCTDGLGPSAGLIQAANGDFYGTTSQGGANGYGTVFSVSVGPGAFVKAHPAEVEAGR
jgi:uncharacterized repeat protein (TIGR03803 family)